MRRTQRFLRNLCCLATTEVIALICVGLVGNYIDPDTRLIIFEVASYIGATELVIAVPCICYEAYIRCCKAPNAETPPVVSLAPPAIIISTTPEPTNSAAPRNKAASLSLLQIVPSRKFTV